MRKLAREALYEAAFQENDEGRLAALLSEALGARSTLAHWMAERPDILSSSYFTQDVIDGFREHAHLDPWSRAAAGRMVPGRAVRLSRLVPERDYLASAFYNEFVQPIGDDTAHCMGVVFVTPGGLGAVALHRGRRQGDFDAAQEAGLQEVAADLGRILSLRGRLAAAERRALRLGESLDAFARAVIHAAPDGRLLFANAAAEALLRRGLGLCVRGGVLAAAVPKGQNRLAQALHAATAAGSGDAFVLPRSDGGEGYRVTALPLGRAAGAPAALLVITDPDAAPAPQLEPLRAFYGLTRSEAAVCQSLTEGLSVTEIAAAREVKVSTVRTLLQHAMRKVGTTRQGELIAILARLTLLRPPG